MHNILANLNCYMGRHEPQVRMEVPRVITVICWRCDKMLAGRILTDQDLGL